MKNIHVVVFVFLLFAPNIVAAPFLDKQCGNIRQKTCHDSCNEILSYCPLDDRPHTFMFTKPVYRSIEAQLALWHETLSNYCEPSLAASQCIMWYQHSIHSKKIDRFFLFNNLNTVVIKGDAVVNGNSNLRDMRAEWLGLPSDFQGSFTIPIKQQQYGWWPEIKVDLKDFMDHSFFERFWFAFAFPLQLVINDARVEQSLVTNAGAQFPNGLIDAFNNPTLLNGKFNPDTQKDGGVAEFNFKLGTKLLDRDGFELGFYSLFLLPFHKSANVEYIFSPLVGNNRHFGVGSGLYMQLPLSCDPCKEISFVFEAETIYFFTNTQRRILGVHGKPWAQYLRLNSNTGRMNVPATQVLTQKVNVKPYNMIEAVGAIRCAFSTVEAEVGYHVWARGRETIKLKHPFIEEWGIAGNGAIVPGTGNIGATASRSTISHQAANDIDIFSDEDTFIAIREKDLDFSVGTSPAAISHRAYVSVGWFLESCYADLIVNTGAYLEIPQYNTSLPNGGIWAKIGIFL